MQLHDEVLEFSYFFSTLDPSIAFEVERAEDGQEIVTDETGNKLEYPDTPTRQQRMTFTHGTLTECRRVDYFKACAKHHSKSLRMLLSRIEELERPAA